MTADEFVSLANENGAGIELGEPLYSTEGEVYALTLEEEAGEEHAAEDEKHAAEEEHAAEEHGHEHGGGSLNVADSEEQALAEYEQCEAAATLLCYRAANIAVVFEGLSTEERARLDAAFRAIEAE
jgi:hypothetical protein